MILRAWSAFVFRDAVNPLRCAALLRASAARRPGASFHVRPFDACVSLGYAVHAPPKPGVAILGNPRNACVAPLEAAGELSSLSPATLRHRASLRSSRPIHVSAFVACNSPCIAHKASDLPSRQIPFDVYVLPCFARPGKQSSLHSHAAHPCAWRSPLRHGLLDKEEGMTGRSRTFEVNRVDTCYMDVATDRRTLRSRSGRPVKVTPLTGRRRASTWMCAGGTSLFNTRDDPKSTLLRSALNLWP